jgi:hypothetical protein
MRQVTIAVAVLLLQSACLASISPKTVITTVPGNWTLAWNDEFDGPDGTKPSATKVRFCPPVISRLVSSVCLRARHSIILHILNASYLVIT